MKKIAHSFLTLIGISALIWVCGEPEALSLKWAFGEVIGLTVMVLAFKGADALKTK